MQYESENEPEEESENESEEESIDVFLIMDESNKKLMLNWR